MGKRQNTAFYAARWWQHDNWICHNVPRSDAYFRLFPWVFGGICASIHDFEPRQSGCARLLGWFFRQWGRSRTRDRSIYSRYFVDEGRSWKQVGIWVGRCRRSSGICYHPCSGADVAVNFLCRHAFGLAPICWIKPSLAVRYPIEERCWWLGCVNFGRIVMEGLAPVSPSLWCTCSPIVELISRKVLVLIIWSWSPLKGGKLPSRRGRDFNLDQKTRRVLRLLQPFSWPKVASAHLTQLNYTVRSWLHMQMTRITRALCRQLFWVDRLKWLAVRCFLAPICDLINRWNSRIAPIQPHEAWSRTTIFVWAFIKELSMS